MFIAWQKLRLRNIKSAPRCLRTASTATPGEEQTALPVATKELTARPVTEQELTALPFDAIPSPPRYPVVEHSYLFRRFFLLYFSMLNEAVFLEELCCQATF
jgi:hypothetical protein